MVAAIPAFILLSLTGGLLAIGIFITQTTNTLQANPVVQWLQHLSPLNTMLLLISALVLFLMIVISKSKPKRRRYR